jgi:hypothetical protein
MGLDKSNQQDMDSRQDRLEQLLREHGRAGLSADFERSVMQQINALPAPNDMGPRNWRDLRYVIAMLSAAEKVAAVLIICALCTLLIPGTTDLLALWSYQLEGTVLSLSIGDSAVSASLLSLIVLGLAAAFLAGIGAYSTRNRLLSA